jgi:hypothetical protein
VIYTCRRRKEAARHADWSIFAKERMKIASFSRNRNRKPDAEAIPKQRQGVRRSRTKDFIVGSVAAEERRWLHEK